MGKSTCWFFWDCIQSGLVDMWRWKFFKFSNFESFKVVQVTWGYLGLLDWQRAQRAYRSWTVPDLPVDVLTTRLLARLKLKFFSEFMSCQRIGLWQRVDIITLSVLEIFEFVPARGSLCSVWGDFSDIFKKNINHNDANYNNNTFFNKNRDQLQWFYNYLIWRYINYMTLLIRSLLSIL